MKRVLITGGAGFIGSHLAKYLLSKKIEVFIVDNLSTGRATNLSDVRNHPKLHFHVTDIQEHSSLLMEWVDLSDVIFHLAASVGVKLIVSHPAKGISNNVYTTEIMLKLAAGKNKKIFIASTSEVYGKTTKLPFEESQDLVFGPSYIGRWSYACSKAIDEFLALAYHKESGLPVVIGRLFNTVGPGQLPDYGMVIPRLVGQALASQDITVYGDGTQSRCFCHVSDVCKAIVHLVETPGCVGKVFNIGNDKEITIQNLAEKIIQLTRSQSKIINVPFEQAYTKDFEDMKRRVPSLTKIRSHIRFEPQKSLDDILKEAIQWAKEYRVSNKAKPRVRNRKLQIKSTFYPRQMISRNPKVESHDPARLIPHTPHGK